MSLFIFVVWNNWYDNTPFIVNLFDQETYGHIVLIPEPATLSLFTLGSLVTFYCRKRK